ncbi:MAG: molybdopterin converting factor subunit 1 [Armatimonadaceae bacterium]
MTVTVLFFAHYRDIVPDGKKTVALNEGSTVADLSVALAAQDNRLADLLTRTRVAVGAEFAEPETRLRDRDEVAFLPPMSGG